MAKSGGGGGRSARVSPVRNSEGMILGYQAGGRAFGTRREATAAARTAAIQRIPGSQFMNASELQRAMRGGPGRTRTTQERARGARAATGGMSATERGAARFRRAEMAETFRARVFG